MSNCSNCGVIKTKDNTNLSCITNDGLRPTCKKCYVAQCKNYEKTPSGYLMRSYRNMKSRVEGVQKRKAHLYDGLYILPKEEFKIYEKDNTFLKLLEEYKKSGWKIGKAPSVDRIYPWFGYHKDNIQWITHQENSSRTRGVNLCKNLDYDANNIHFVSDLHFLHKNILKYNRDYFSSTEEMTEYMVKEWNSQVKPNDLVFNLGDISIGNMKKTKETLLRLNGFIIHLKGNHNDEKEYEFFSEDNPKQIFLDSPYFKVKINEFKLILCHFPILSWEDMHKGSIHLYGHCHGSLKFADKLGKSLDVGVDNTRNFTGSLRPVSLVEVCSYMSQREVVSFDHHEEGGN